MKPMQVIDNRFIIGIDLMCDNSPCQRSALTAKNSEDNISVGIINQ
ncbi:MAG: hypothetical protein JETT_0547 [Candidatus Jettenia ecosi]|uniref:Uncharacterized protein n=1 Tax=Candidatus Jettenia ecosi TaxID=2494326 RepID=A0A533QES0_9BACT|nr:MAG: hypothetical protein JETT_0547 [Candidatus Jettenia ecosi]